MTNVYDIIMRIRDGKKLTTRQLAIMAGIAPTTLESAFQRKPSKVSIRMLYQLASVFGVKWYEFLVPPAKAHTMEKESPANRIPCDEISDEDAEKIVEYFLGLPQPEPKDLLGHVVPKFGHAAEHRFMERRISANEHFCQSIMVVLRKLNSDGLMEVMRHALEVANNPAYTRKEESSCDKNNAP